MGYVEPLRTLIPECVTDGYCQAGATISKCGKYRYRLWREWRSGNATHWDMWTDDNDDPAVDGAGNQLGTPKSCVFVMLNPSTADGEQDDPTIRRCVGFAKAWGYDRLEVINLFAYRATNPKALLALNHGDDPVGVENCDAFRRAIWDADMVVCAWGAHGGHIRQDETALGWIYDSDVETYALRLTKDGHPAHPLYLPAHLKPFVWTPL